MKNNGGPVFPIADISKTQCRGISLRDWFAGMAMQGFLMNIEVIDENCHVIIDSVIKIAYRYADAMIAERDREQNDNPNGEADHG